MKCGVYSVESLLIKNSSYFNWMELVMFPTRVGMNRVLADRVRVYVHVPHARGDEPSEVTAELTSWGC